MFENLKLTLEEIAEVLLRKEQLVLAGVEPVNRAGIYYAGCGDGGCAQTCSGGCGHDCSEFFSECLLHI